MKSLQERQADRVRRDKIARGEIRDDVATLGVAAEEFAEGYNEGEDTDLSGGGGTGAPERNGDGGTGKAKPLTSMTKAELKIYIAARGGKVEGDPKLGDLLAQAQELPAEEGNGSGAGNGAGTGAGVAGGDTGPGSATGTGGTSGGATNPGDDEGANNGAAGSPAFAPNGGQGWPTA